jgi:DNA sulfur modification protein DndD
MLLQSIKLVNFRQFLNEEIAFASGKDGKNVTIILGENGTGKTTFAQAFFWCLYGETEFSDKMILNRFVANKLLSGQSAKVSVELVLQHGENTYTITREQTYTKDGSGNIKGANTVFDILRRDKTGNTTAIKPTLRETEIKSILPKELSKYFFFDGERIERMSKDISTHKKATDFADAVRSLLGLKGMEKAIQHLNPGSKTSVIGQYEASYDASSNTRIAELTRTIEECNEKIEKLNARINELDRQIELAQTRKAQKTEELKQYEDGEKWQSQKEKLEKRIAAAKQARSNMVKAICLDFSGNIGSFLSLWMTQKAMQMLQNRDFTGKDIPHMHGDTIEYLLHQKVCICGTHLTEGSVPYEKVKSLIDYLPPKSLSANISDFKKAAVRRVSGAQQTNLLDQVTEHLSVISQQEDEIINLSEDLHAVEQKLSGDDVRAKVRAINAEIQQCDKAIHSSQEERDKCISDRGDAQGRKERADTRRGELALLDESNKKTEIYKAYAERVYRELVEFYNKSEDEVRTRLQDTINEIFKQIYEGGLALTIDDKYHISVYADDYHGNVETSTAQSISVIFAFITGIIKMARDNRNATNEDDKLLSSEPYPLVMDAPLSAFDKRRIKTVCTALPEVAEQVVIFIKDTDGDLAEEHMGDRIGSRHRFEKLNEFETKLV